MPLAIPSSLRDSLAEAVQRNADGRGEQQKPWRRLVAERLHA